MHDHPEIAGPWQEECVKGMLRRQGVVRVTGDQCRYGLTPNDGYRENPAKTRASFMTHSQCIATKLSLHCPNTKERKAHDRVILTDGRAKAAQVYPPALCPAVCVGLIEQIEADRKGQFFIASVNIDESSGAKQMTKEADATTDKYKIV